MIIYVSEAAAPAPPPANLVADDRCHIKTGEVAPAGAPAPVLTNHRTSHDQRTMMQPAIPQNLSRPESTPVAEPAIQSTSREGRE